MPPVIGSTTTTPSLTPTSVTPPSAKLVRQVEGLLKKAGFNVGALDGKVSPALTAAVKQFQTAEGLSATGELDTGTVNRLRKVGDRISAHKKDGFVSVGQKSKSIADIEKRLGRLGYDVGKADGVYSQQTAAAVKAFKADEPQLKDKGGYLALKAQSVLKQEVAKLGHAPERRRLPPPRGQVRLDANTAKAVASAPLVEGSRGAAVKNVQKHLGAAGYAPKHANGVFDERTGAAVKAFQKHAGLPVTGQVTPATWSALKKSYIMTRKPAAPAQSVGERSRAVLASEKLLKKLGLHPGKVDGLFNKQTERAVKAFEKKHHLKRDGTITTGELKAMKKAAAGDYRTRALAIARKYLGFHEKGDNGNPFSKYFGRAPEAWCADFVSYCYTKGGKKLNEYNVPHLEQRMKNNGTFNRSHPKAGDIVVFGGGAHTGLVEKVYRSGGQTWVQTIEGNSGDAVRRHNYPLNSSYLTGFGTIP